MRALRRGGRPNEVACEESEVLKALSLRYRKGALSQLMSGPHHEAEEAGDLERKIN